MPRPPSKRARGFYRHFFIPADPWVGRRAAVGHGAGLLNRRFLLTWKAAQINSHLNGYEAPAGQDPE